MLLPVILEKPTFSAVTLEEAKKHLDVLGFDDDDAEIAGIIASAIEHLEKRLGLTLCKTKYRQDFHDYLAAARLTIQPVINIEEIRCHCSDGTQTQLSADKFSLIQTDKGAIIQFFGEQPKLAKRADALQISFYAGYEREEIPASLKAAILIHCSILYEHRPNTSNAKPVLNDAYEALIRPWWRPCI